MIEISALFRGPGTARAATDAAILAAAAGIGFMSVAGLPSDIPLGRAARADLLRIFGLDEGSLRALWRRKFEPRNRNVYRGWFPLQPGNVTLKEGIDMGADLAYGAGVACAADPLRELTPLPAESALPGWRSAAASCYVAMERVCVALMRSIARSLGLADGFFDDSFREGLSTLRLLHYPARTPEELASCADPQVWVTHHGVRRFLTGAAHTDSGFMTLLAQDRVAGLQVRTHEGSWIDVPPEEQALVVNFGQVLERWSAGRIRATEHRVVGAGGGALLDCVLL